MSTVLKVEKRSRQYRHGSVGTGSLAHDLNRTWHWVRGKEDPYLKFGEENDRSVRGRSEYVWALKDINFEVRSAFAMHPAARYTEPLPKQLLINCFKNILPEAVWNRPKMGFSFPFDEWFGQNEMLKDTLGNSRYKESYQRFKDGDLRWYQAMLLLLLQQKEPALA